MVTKKRILEIMKDCNRYTDLSEEEEAVIIKYESKGTQLLGVSKCKSGWLSPNGMFFPCEWASHERTREFLCRLFKIGIDEKEMARTELFEKTWVKFQEYSPSNYYDLRPQCPSTHQFTPKQKVFLADWYKVHYKAVLKEKGSIVINWKFCIDDTYNIRLNE